MAETDKALAAVVKKKMDVILSEGEDLSVEIGDRERELNMLKTRWQEMRASYLELHAVYFRNLDARTSDMPEDLPPAGRPGPTHYVERVLQDAATVGKRFSRDELTRFLISALKDHDVASSTSDPDKMGASVIGNLVKRGRLAETPDGYIELQAAAPEPPNYRLAPIAERST